MFWFYFELILWFLWQLPQNLVALVMMPFLGKMELVRFENYCWVFSCQKMMGGISLGNFIFLSPYMAKKEANVRHELGHTVQSHMLGWLYLLIIGLPSILNAWFNFTECYHSWYPEAWANKLAGLKVGRNQYGCFIYIPNDDDEEMDEQ